MDMPKPGQFVYYIVGLEVIIRLLCPHLIRYVNVDLACRLIKTWDRHLNIKEGDWDPEELEMSRKVVWCVNWMHGSIPPEYTITHKCLECLGSHVPMCARS